MKKILCFILSAVVLGFFLTACKPKVDVEKEKAAVKAVIYGETQAWLDKDTAKFNAYYVQDKFQTRLVAQCDTSYAIHGWDKLAPVMDNINWTGIENFKFSKDFIDIKVMGNVAWAIYKETQSYSQNGTSYKYDLLPVMVLEKISNNWKISCLTIYVSTPPPSPPAEKKKSK